MPANCPSASLVGDGGIHPDDMPEMIRQWTTRIPRVDGGIDLDEVFEPDTPTRSPEHADEPSESGDDSTGHGEPEVERGSKGETEFTLPHVIGRRPSCGGNDVFRSNRQHGDVGGWIAADDFRGPKFTIEELHFEGITAFDDVKVGDNVPRVIVDPAAAGGDRNGHAVDLLHAGNVHDRWSHEVRQVGRGVAQFRQYALARSLVGSGKGVQSQSCLTNGCQSLLVLNFAGEPGQQHDGWNRDCKHHEGGGKRCDQESSTSGHGGSPP